MWWVVSQLWLNSDSNELSQSWVRLVNLGFELSQSWVTWIVIWVRVESSRKNESSTTLLLNRFLTISIVALVVLRSLRHFGPFSSRAPAWPSPPTSGIISPALSASKTSWVLMCKICLKPFSLFNLDEVQYFVCLPAYLYAVCDMFWNHYIQTFPLPFLESCFRELTSAVAQG